MGMTDAELIEAQHRVILNSPCRCEMHWVKDTLTVRKQCTRCAVIIAYEERKCSNVAT